MALGQLPRLSTLSKSGVQEWSDQFAGRLENLFQSPRRIGLVEIIQFALVADQPGSLVIPTSTLDILLQWGTDTIAGASSAQAVTFPVMYETAAFFAIAIGDGTNAFPYSISALSLTGFTANASNGGLTDDFMWLAIGS